VRRGRLIGIAVSSLLALGLPALGCAGPGTPSFERQSNTSPGARWLALAKLAKQQDWTVAAADATALTFVAYAATPAASGVRDRIAVKLLAASTLITTSTEIQNGGDWLRPSRLCASYTFSREQALASQLESEAALASLPPSPP